MNEHYTAVIRRLGTARISSSTYRAAIGLLNKATNTGYVELSHEATKEVMQVKAWGTVRGHLIALQNAGVILKWLNHSTRVYFVDYPPQQWMLDDPEVITQRAKVISGRSEVIKTPTPAEDAPTYGHRQIFPILTQQDRTDCLARPFWWIASIKVSDETTVYECRPQ